MAALGWRIGTQAVGNILYAEVGTGRRHFWRETEMSSHDCATSHSPTPLPKSNQINLAMHPLPELPSPPTLIQTHTPCHVAAMFPSCSPISTAIPRPASLPRPTPPLHHRNEVNTGLLLPQISQNTASKGQVLRYVSFDFKHVDSIEF